MRRAPTRPWLFLRAGLYQSLTSLLQPSCPVQLPSPHHVDGLRVTSKAEGIATGCGPKVNGHNHGERSLLWSSGLWLLQVQDLKSGNS